MVSATLPVEVSYDHGVGVVPANYNPMSRLLRWQMPLTLSNQAELSFGYVG